MSKRDSATLDVLALWLPPVIWGGLVVAAADVLTVFGPAGLTAITLAIAAVILAPISARTLWSERRAILTELPYLAVMACLGFAAFQYLWYRGLLQSNPVSVALLTPTLPIFVSVGAWLVLREARGVRTAFAFVVGAVGVLWISLEGSFAQLTHWQPSRGDGFVIAANVVMAAYTLLLRARPPRVSASTFITMTAALGSLIACGGLLLVGPDAGDFAARAPGPGALAHYARELLYVGGLSNAFAYLLWARSVASNGAVLTALCLNAQPVAGVIAAVTFLDAPITFVHATGACLIAGGLVLAHLDGNR